MMEQEQEQKKELDQEHHSRGGDFAIGFFGTIGVGLTCTVFGAFGNSAIAGAAIIAVVLLLIGAFYAFARGRGFIGVGILSLLAIPLLVLGACAVMLSGLH